MKTNDDVYDAAFWDVYRDMHLAVDVPVFWAMDGAVPWTVNEAVRTAVDRELHRAVDRAVRDAVDRAARGDPPHPSISNFRTAADQGAP